jgi:uncharacterized YigZ family protein
MLFVDKEYTETLEIKKSKFIAHIAPYDKYEDMMIRLRNKHPKARHFVYAYRYLNEFDQVVENSSDDGEPKGTSGKPSLSVLAGADIINTGVIIIRYFGGVKLGTGGLVKAYSDAVNLVLQSSVLKEFVKLEYKKLIVEYPELSQIEYLISQYSITIREKIFTEKIELTLEASLEEFQKLSKELSHNLHLEDL